MKKKDSPRERAMRLMLAALLQADVDHDELLSILNEIDGLFISELRTRLGAALSYKPETAEPATARSPSLQHGKRAPLLDAIYSHVRAKKISSARLTRYLLEVAPSSIDQSSYLKPNLELLGDFLKVATPAQAQALLAKVAGVSGSVEDDPYLSGITSRGERK